jgi:hypothetical protein
MKVRFDPNISNWGKWSVLWIDSSHIEACLDAYKDGDAIAIGLNPALGFRETDLAFLRGFPNLKGLVIPYPEKLNLKMIDVFSELEILVLGKNRKPVNFSQFSELKELSIDWQKADTLPMNGSKLARLSLWGYSPNSKDLCGVPTYPQLTYLRLTQGTVENLKDIERFGSLIEAEFAYLKHLKSISAIGISEIKKLEIDTCRRIEDFESLSKCKNLEHLLYCNNASLKSLSIIKKFKNLTNFRFVNTNIIDGDMTPLFGLKSVGFLNKRHYSHTIEQIASEIGDTKMLEVLKSFKGANTVLT